MKAAAHMVGLWMVCIVGGLAFGAASPAETLKIADLVNRPDRWPAEVTLKRDFRFGGGASAKAGQKVTVLEFNGGAVGVDAGNGLLFEIGPDDSDLLDAANAIWTKLTPAQRAVDVAAVKADASLWPEKVKSLDGFRLDNGKDIPPGQEYELMAIDGNTVVMWLTAEKSKLTSDISKTDVVARARERAAIEPDKRSSRIAAGLAGKLVDADGKPWDKQDLEKSKVFALYYGASWCGPCRQFSPSLVKFANEVAGQHPELTIVLMSNDEKDADMMGYMKEEKMPWPALPLAKLNATPVFLGYVKGAIPQFAIVDRHGKLIADCYQNGRYVGPQMPMAALKKHLSSASASAK